jgi:hypothetical protein
MLTGPSFFAMSEDDGRDALMATRMPTSNPSRARSTDGTPIVTSGRTRG